jgi:suppressor of fused-like protein
VTEAIESPGPGWAAIDERLLALPSMAGPFRFDLDGATAETPLDGVAVLPREGHWHYVTYGLTELYEKVSPHANESGYGFELTFRLPRGRGEARPPEWPVRLLRSVAAYVLRTGERLEPGHHVDVGGPLTDAVRTELCALLVCDDPELAEVAGPFGRFRFLQLVGLCDDELDLLVDWDPAALRALLAEDDARLVTNPGRASLLADDARRAHVKARVAREGSAMDWIFSPLRVELDGHAARLSLAPETVAPLCRLLLGRLGHGRPLTVEGGEGTLELRPGDAPRWAREGDALVVSLPREEALHWRAELAEQPGGATREFLQDLRVRIAPLEG